MLWNTTARGEIFVIDDDTAMRETLTAALDGAGYRAICFADGPALLSQMRVRMPVCVLLEVRMPDRDGLDILKKLRDENCPVPIFVTSADGDIATAVEAVRSGAHDFIEKPVRATTLSSASRRRSRSCRKQLRMRCLTSRCAFPVASLLRGASARCWRGSRWARRTRKPRERSA